MSPTMRSLTAALALVLVAGGSVVYQGRTERPGPPRPAPALAAARPAASSAAPPTARQVLARRAALGLRGEQVARLEALDRLWAHEAGALDRRIHAAEAEFSRFATEGQQARRVSLSEIQRRAAGFSELSAERKERRRHHADAALRVLDAQQRGRLEQARPRILEGGSHDARRQ